MGDVMGKDTSIAWCDHTFNPWIGCTKVSAGCRNCYAEHDTPVRVHRGRGLELWGADAARYVTSADNWKKPRRWNDEAARTGKRARVFCASLADVFEDRDDLIQVRRSLFELIESTPWLDWLLLTKRPENMLRFAPEAWRELWPANLWAGTTVEDQARAEERIPHLLQVPAQVRFLSVEPMLEPVDLTDLVNIEEGVPGEHHYSALDCDGDPQDDDDWHGATISWVICGGESGHKARPFDLAWARSLREQCSVAGVPFFMKQIGSMPEQGAEDAVLYGSLTEIHDSAGADPEEWPRDLRNCRAFPV
jgi:protein gp37